MNYYAIRHLTKFRYSEPISESIMEVHIQPRSEDIQRCVSFHLHTSPRAQIMSYRDDLGNIVHHFNIPNRHKQLTLLAEAQVEMFPAPSLPDALPESAWDELDALTATDEYWDTLMPSKFARPSPLLNELTAELAIERSGDPLTLLRRLTTAIYESFEYDQGNTDVDSPIEDALKKRRGVCQDFTHIMITMIRELHIPCRYVSGYLFHDNKDHSAPDATHAWVEAYLPGLNWVGFDPTNNLRVADRHIRVAVGRDYADVPPTRGIFKGKAESELGVAVQVSLTDREVKMSRRAVETEFSMVMKSSEREMQEAAEADEQEQQQQQQQQQ